MKEFSNPTPPRILLVEDNGHDSAAFCRTLKKSCPGCEISRCIRAEEALEQLRHRASWFDLLVVDHKLPGMSGLDLCQQLLRENTGIPLVLLTGMGSEQLAVEALKMGVSDYIVKDTGGSYLELLPVILADVIKKHAWHTARLQAEEALRKSEEKFRMMVDNAYDAIFILQDEIMKFPNPRTLQMLGCTARELEKIPFSRFIHPSQRHKVMEKHQKDLQEKKISSLYSLRLINKDEQELWADLNAVGIHWEGKPAVLYFLRDITEKKQLESQLLQVQKMQALGVMAGGIAHDFNNLLMCILSNVALIFNDTNGNDPDHPHYKELKNIEQCVRNGAGLTRQLLGFARGGKYETLPTDLNRVIEETLDMFQRTGKDITIHKDYKKELDEVEVDRGQINQVLLNIFLNARQAMPGGGDLYITTDNVTIQRDQQKNIELSPGNYTRITVRDTGVGIDEETCRRIFEPFFTTWGHGQGMGLGLASAYGIIKNHGGVIRVSSTPGKGAAFDIYLPASKKKTRKKKKLPPGPTRSAPTGTVLFVDDEEMLTQIGEQVLGKMGYSVLTAANGAEAVAIFKKNKNRVNLVILDIIMPGKSAPETYGALKKINPDIKVLLSSGYGMDNEVEKLLESGCRGFIQKPFYMKELSRKIESIMKECEADRLPR